MQTEIRAAQRKASKPNGHPSRQTSPRLSGAATRPCFCIKTPVAQNSDDKFPFRRQRLKKRPSTHHHFPWILSAAPLHIRGSSSRTDSLPSLHPLGPLPIPRFHRDAAWLGACPLLSPHLEPDYLLVSGGLMIREVSWDGGRNHLFQMVCIEKRW
jgi:hypothetical protein